MQNALTKVIDIKGLVGEDTLDGENMASSRCPPPSQPHIHWQRGEACWVFVFTAAMCKGL